MIWSMCVFMRTSIALNNQLILWVSGILSYWKAFVNISLQEFSFFLLYRLCKNHLRHYLYDSFSIANPAYNAAPSGKADSSISKPPL